MVYMGAALLGNAVSIDESVGKGANRCDGHELEG